MAKEYYDSVVNVLPKDDNLYKQVSDRQEVLSDFVTQVSTIQEQDSLLNLAKMDTAALNRLIDQTIADQQKKADEEKKVKEREQRQNQVVQPNVFQAFNNTNNSGNTSTSGATWYFYNQTAVGMGQNEFKRIWGDRKLEDHWRRSNKEVLAQFNPEPENTSVNGNAAKSIKQTNDQDLSAKKAAMMATIPFTEDAKKTALDKIEKAYYNLGNIYNFKLNEKSNAASSFETLLKRFPDSKNEPDVRYLLYLIYGDLNLQEKRQSEADTLISKFPNSIFSKLIKNPNYREESNVASEKLKTFYNKAFHFYEIDSLKQALAVINEGTGEYPDNDFSDNMQLLKILITGKEDGIYKYQYELENFKKKYPDSELLSYVDTLLSASRQFQQDELQKKKIQYVQYFDQVHYFVIIYPSKGALADKLPSEIDKFDKTYFADDKLKIGNLTFDDNNAMILINEFPRSSSAIDYYKKFNDKVTLLKDNPSLKIYNFVISKDNFQILYQTKGVKEYMDFFQKNY